MDNHRQILTRLMNEINRLLNNLDYDNNRQIHQLLEKKFKDIIKSMKKNIKVKSKSKSKSKIINKKITKKSKSKTKSKTKSKNINININKKNIIKKTKKKNIKRNSSNLNNRPINSSGLYDNIIDMPPSMPSTSRSD